MQLVIRGKTQRHGVVVVDKRVPQLVLLVAYIIYDVRGLCPLLQSETLGHRSRNNVAHDNLQRYHFDTPTQLVAVVQRLDVVALDTRISQIFEYDARYFIVQYTFVYDSRLLDIVESRCSILISDDDLILVIRQVELLDFAIVKHLKLLHLSVYLFDIYLIIKSTNIGK